MVLLNAFSPELVAWSCKTQSKGHSWPCPLHHTYLWHDLQVALGYLCPSLSIVTHHILTCLYKGIGGRNEWEELQLLRLVVQHLTLWSPGGKTHKCETTPPLSQEVLMSMGTHCGSGSPCLLTTLYLVAMVIALARDLATIMTMPERTMTMVP